MGNHLSYETVPVDLDLGDRGSIRGVQYDSKARRFAGVPYALPPTGDFRWRKPRPLPASYVYQDQSSGPYDATRLRSICPQAKFDAVAEAEGGSKYSEDCLFMNIWTPVPRPGSKPWPVMLWLHGGWFQIGDPSHEPGMDPTELISTGGLNAVFVAIGYRLNVFGFLAGSPLLEDAEGASVGNYGLWDQRAAMEWVYQNISLFGGDPNNITLAGRSAGAYSVEAQTLYQLRANGDRDCMFRRIFMDSNAIPAQPKSVRDCENQFDELCTKLGISESLPGSDKAAALRQVSASRLIEVISKMENHTFRPVTDELFVHSGMVEYLKSPEFANQFTTKKLRLLIGEVLNEETLYATYNSPNEPNVDALRLQLSNYYAPEVAERVMKSYSLPDSDDVQDWKTTFGHIIADGQVRAPSRALVQNLITNGVSIDDVWRYQVAYRLSFIDESVAPASYGVAHAMDKPFWNFSICHLPTPEERRLMEDWIQILVAFVHNDQSYQYGTRSVQDMKVATPEGRIEVQRDERWDRLLKVADLFAEG